MATLSCTAGEVCVYLYDECVHVRKCVCVCVCVLVRLRWCDYRSKMSLSLIDKTKRKGFFGSLFRKSSGATPTPGEPDGDDDQPEAKAAAATPPKAKDEKKVKVRRNNANALALYLGALAKEPNQLLGSLCYCTQCAAAVSSLSQLTTSNDITTWTW